MIKKQFNCELKTDYESRRKRMSFRAPFWSPSQASAILFDWDGVIAESRLDFSGIRAKYYGGARAMLLEDSHALEADARVSMMRDLEELEVRGAMTADRVPGITDVLDWVSDRGIPWAVVSRNCKKSILIAAEKIGIALPEVVISRDCREFVKPDPRALVDASSSLNTPPSQTLFIGDFIYDMMGARRAGMRGVLVKNNIPNDWAEWLECSFDTMLDLYSELTSPSDITAWEYQDTARRLGHDFLLKTSKLKLEIPTLTTPNITTWLTRAASLGAAHFTVPDAILSPSTWKLNQALEPSDMGLPMVQALASFMRVRYPLASILPPSSDALLPPGNADELEHFLLSLLG